MTMKKMQKSLDTVKSDVRELVEAFWALRDEVMTHQAVSAAEQQSRSAMPVREGPVDRLTAHDGEASPSGYVEQFGHYEMTDTNGIIREHRWAMAQRPIEDVLALQVDRAAAVLAAIGHKQRLGIVLMLLRQPATANDIVAGLSLGTTGAAYHHLNVLQRDGLVQQEQRGVFSIVPEQVPTLIAILTGLSGLIETSVENVQSEAPAAVVPKDELASDDLKDVHRGA
jgi:DNA-binding transcriptional ArsR family regulator